MAILWLPSHTLSHTAAEITGKREKNEKERFLSHFMSIYLSSMEIIYPSVNISRKSQGILPLFQ